jgi:hypothetical protein
MKDIKEVLELIGTDRFVVELYVYGDERSLTDIDHNRLLELGWKSDGQTKWITKAEKKISEDSTCERESTKLEYLATLPYGELLVTEYVKRKPKKPKVNKNKPGRKKGHKNKIDIPWKITFSDGSITEVISLNKFAKENNFGSSGNLYRISQGLQKSCSNGEMTVVHIEQTTI